MPALTIRHGGTVFSGHAIRGSGRPGSVGIHVVAGLDLVIIHACTIKGFDVGILAESPVLIVNSEVMRYGAAGVLLRSEGSSVLFCSFLDQGGQMGAVAPTDVPPGAAIVSVASGTVVKANCFEITGADRWFGLKLSTRGAWESENNIGVATKVFGTTAVALSPSNPDAAFAVARESSLDGILEESPGFGSTAIGDENLRLFSSSSAIGQVAGAIAVVANDYFDQATGLPKVDRLGNHRPVEFLTIGAHEMSFAMTKPGRRRVLELLSGVSSKPFDRVASGRDGMFMRLPETASNSTSEAIESPLDIQPSPALSVLSYRDKKYGASSLYFKPERGGRVPVLVSAAPSRKSAMNGARELTVYGWVKPLSKNADIILHRSGRGRAQDRPVIEARLQFRGYVAPNLSLKCSRVGKQGIDYTFVAESAQLQTLISTWIARDLWVFIAFAWDTTGVKVYVGAEGDRYLRGFSARPFVLDARTEEMIGGATAVDLRMLDPNTEVICVGSDAAREHGWHGYIDGVAIDIGVALSRLDLEAIFSAVDGLPGSVRLLREVPQTDVIVARSKDVRRKPPEAPEREVSILSEYFTEIRRIVAFGPALYVAGKARGADSWGAFRVVAGKLDVLVDNIANLIDLQVDRNGYAVLAASDYALSRIDPEEGVRYEIKLPIALTPTALGVGFDNEFYVAAGASVYAVTAPDEISSEAVALVELLAMDTPVTNITALEVGPDGYTYAIDRSATPKIVRISSGLAFSRLLGFGLNAGVSVGTTLSISGVNFTDIGVRPGDLVELVSVDDDLQTPQGESVFSSADPLIRTNAGPRRVQSVTDDALTVDVTLVNETPSAGKQFELRVTRRSTVDAPVATGAPLVAPTGLARNPYDERTPILIMDPAAKRDAGDPELGVVFAFRVDRGLSVLHSMADLGISLADGVDVAVADNPYLSRQQVAARLLSRLSWSMEYEQQGSRISNAASPGDSDLVLPDLSLSDLLIVMRAQTAVEDTDPEAVLRWSGVFESDPALDAAYLNDEYENLSELGVVTEDGVLLGRAALARMPYDPLSEVSTLWEQTLRVRS